MSSEYFIRGSIIQTLMGFHGIAEVNEPDKPNTPVNAVFKGSLAVPHAHQGANNRLGFTVGLRPIAGKLLIDAVLPASVCKSMISIL